MDLVDYQPKGRVDTHIVKDRAARMHRPWERTGQSIERAISKVGRKQAHKK